MQLQIIGDSLVAHVITVEDPYFYLDLALLADYKGLKSVAVFSVDGTTPVIYESRKPPLPGKTLG